MRRLLGAARLAPAGDVERERRRAAADVRAAERERAKRAAAAAAAKIESLEQKLRTAQERAASEREQRTSLFRMLRHYLLRLAHVEADVSGRITGERRVKLVQLAIGAKAARRRKRISSAAASRIAHLASVSPDYSSAVARWMSSDQPADIHQVRVGGLQWSMPATLVTSTAPTPRNPQGNLLPLLHLATVRQFAVGGIMLDLGAGIGTTSIPRVILGEFAPVYATEPDPDRYLCLVGNILDNRVEGRVLPDRVAIAGPGAEDDDVRSLTIDAWMERLSIPADNVRFVRIVLDERNLDALQGATRLLARRHIVWEIEVPSTTPAPRIAELCTFVAAHFTHIRELGGHARTRLHASSEMQALFTAVTAETPRVGFLMFSLGGTRRDAGTAVSASQAPRAVADL
jgi:hypothetical protein